MSKVIMEFAEMNYLVISVEGGKNKHFYSLDIMNPAEALEDYAKKYFTDDFIAASEEDDF